MLSNAHCVSAWSHCMGRLFPTKRLAQLQVAIQNVTLEQTQRNAALNKMRHRYKEKMQQLADVKTICEQEARIKTLEAQRAQLQAGQPCHFVVPPATRRSRRIRRWNRALIRPGY